MKFGSFLATISCFIATTALGLLSTYSRELKVFFKKATKQYIELLDQMDEGLIVIPESDTQEPLVINKQAMTVLM